jgi:hypothetical protein
MASKTKSAAAKRNVSMKSYAFGENRSISIAKDVVTISDSGEKPKTIELTAQRFVTFMFYLKDVDESLRKRCADDFVNFRQHIGGAWYVSVSTGFACIDIRQFYLPLYGIEEKPTKTGFAIRFPEWIAFVAAVQQLMRENEQLADVRPCTDQHMTLEDALTCKECNPFQQAQGVMYSSTSV